MLKENTRKAISIEILLSLRGDGAVKTVETANEIFRQEWSESDIRLMCSYVKEHGAENWASESWENDMEQIYKQVFISTLKATDFQLALWLEKIWGGEKSLKFLVSCEQSF